MVRDLRRRGASEVFPNSNRMERVCESQEQMLFPFSVLVCFASLKGIRASRSGDLETLK